MYGGVTGCTHLVQMNTGSAFGEECVITYVKTPMLISPRDG